MPTKARPTPLTKEQLDRIEQNRARARLLKAARQQLPSTSTPHSASVTGSSSEDFGSSSSNDSTTSSDSARAAAANAVIKKKLDFV